MSERITRAWPKTAVTFAAAFLMLAVNAWTPARADIVYTNPGPGEGFESFFADVANIPGADEGAVVQRTLTSSAVDTLVKVPVAHNRFFPSTDGLIAQLRSDASSAPDSVIATASDGQRLVGSIDVSFDGGGRWLSTPGHVNRGYELDGTPLPEPSTVALLGTGVLGLLVHRWRFGNRHG
jgi:hypothetical protein